MIIIQQLRQIVDIKNVRHEWTAFSDLSHPEGVISLGSETSVDTQPVLDVIKALAGHRKIWMGDPRRFFSVERSG